MELCKGFSGTMVDVWQVGADPRPRRVSGAPWGVVFAPRFTRANGQATGSPRSRRRPVGGALGRCFRTPLYPDQRPGNRGGPHGSRRRPVGGALGRCPHTPLHPGKRPGYRGVPPGSRDLPGLSARLPGSRLAVGTYPGPRPGYRGSPPDPPTGVGVGTYSGPLFTVQTLRRGE
jgi:hypothetical protein